MKEFFGGRENWQNTSCCDILLSDYKNGLPVDGDNYMIIVEEILYVILTKVWIRIFVNHEQFYTLIFYDAVHDDCPMFNDGWNDVDS